ncbi:DUF1120 domain-containing protein [Enterobacteriaceae bacterium 89]|nr:DUF1120 domain-containing protein [Enterobacteriaceae bacterium 89]
MMKMMNKSLCALAVLAVTAVSAQAASNVDVKVIGRIDPGTCTPTLSGGGVVDYGTMSPSILAATGYTLLPQKQVDVSIACTAPSKVALKALNGRPGTVAGASEGSYGFAPQPNGTTIFGSANALDVAGLGKAGNANIGGYGLRITPNSFQADSVAVDGLISDNSGSSWVKSVIGNIFNGGQQRYASWGASGTTSPVAFTNLTGKLDVQAYINDKSQLDLTNTIQLDGLTTLELVYLP